MVGTVANIFSHAVEEAVTVKFETIAGTLAQHLQPMRDDVTVKFDPMVETVANIFSR